MKRVLSVLLAIALILPCFSMVNISAAGQITGQFIGATLNLGATLTIDYYATLSERNDDVIVNFTSSSGRKTTVNGVYDESQKAYKFSYTGINPQCMNDVISASLELSGKVLAQKENYSVKAYCDSQVRKSAEELGVTGVQLNALRTLLADTLVYGAAAQNYTKYNTSVLADSLSWVKNFKSSISNPVGVRNVSGNDDMNNRVIALGVNVANVNKIYFKLNLTDNVTIALNGKTVEMNELILNSEGVYMLYTNDIMATGFDDVYTLTLTKDGTEISKVEYNVNAYIQAKYNDDNVGEIVRALCNYGYSAEKYLKAMNGSDNDFDLEDEDVLGEEFVFNLVTDIDSNFEDASKVSDTSWGIVGSAVNEIVYDEQQGNVLKITKAATTSASYHSATYDLAPIITRGGEYIISFKYKVVGGSDEVTPIEGVIRADSATSFAPPSNDNQFRKGLGGVDIVEDGVWAEATFNLGVEREDIGKGGKWRFCLHNIYETVTEIYIDDFKVIEKTYNDIAKAVTSAETWVANELVLVSDEWYNDAYNDVDVDLELTNGNVTYIIPGFWDGGKIWKVRFVCPTEGSWTYRTICDDTENRGLHNVTNTFECKEYSGDLDVYKHGFVTTSYNKKYFTYADGTPFFYLGDTHWSFGGESLDMIKENVEVRAKQGYNVYQTEPLSVKFDLSNGLTITDISGLRQFDDRFKIIADAGFTHANAQFFFPSQMQAFINKFGGYSDKVLDTVAHTKDKNEETGTYEHPIYDLSDEAKAALERLSRYWVARYSAYPVMWTMAQEIDNDYFWQNSGGQGHPKWNYVNNPFKYVAEYIGKYDPYKHPLSAHMEHSGFKANNTVADSGDPLTSSAFNDVDAHNWYAAQWKSQYTGSETEDIAKIAENFWNSEKITVNYEGKYWMLATKDFGARAQGWGSILSGMFGHGWGGQDAWSYLNTYDEDVTSYYGSSSSYLDEITPEEKQATLWEHSLYSTSAAEMGIMKKFFEETVGDWWNLIPRFEDESYLTRKTESVMVDFLSWKEYGAYAVIASNSDNTEIVTYFYNFTDPNVAENPNASIKPYLGGTKDFGSATGTFGNLIAGATYNYKWFNPTTGEFTSSGTFTADSNGKWDAGSKATCDMVLYISKAQ